MFYTVQHRTNLWWQITNLPHIIELIFKSTDIDTCIKNKRSRLTIHFVEKQAYEHMIFEAIFNNNFIMYDFYFNRISYPNYIRYLNCAFEVGHKGLIRHMFQKSKSQVFDRLVFGPTQYAYHKLLKLLIKMFDTELLQRMLKCLNINKKILIDNKDDIRQYTYLESKIMDESYSDKLFCVNDLINRVNSRLDVLQ